MALEDRYCPYCMGKMSEGDVCPSCGRDAAAYVPSPHHLPPGTVLADRYVIGGVIGEGGFGITYIAYDRHLQRKAAVKEYYPLDRATRNSGASLSLVSLTGPAGETFERGRRRFLDEARIMASLEKQGAIVSVQDHFEANNTAYIVMEYVEGETLKQLVARRGPMTPEELLPLMEPVLRALSALHGNGLIHRDISPDNLMLENGALRLLDFGCAREADQGQETLTIALKRGYAPIEQYRQKGQGPWTDVYALCATIYFCLTGMAPPQPLDRVPEDTLLLPSKLGAPLSRQQEQALLKGLRIQTRRRFQSVEELRQALYEELPLPAEDEGEKTPAVSTGGRTRRSRKRRLCLASLGCLALACVVAAVFFAARPRIGSPARPGEGQSVSRRLFDGGLELSGGAFGRETFLRIMEDESVESVILRGGALLDLNTSNSDATVLKKPLLVEEGSVLCANLLTVPDGSALLVEGTLDCRGLIALEGDGTRLQLKGGLSPEGEELAVILMERGGNLSMDGELARSMGKRLVVRPETEGAYKITDLRTLNEGLRLYDTLLIDGSLTLSQMYDVTGKTLILSGDAYIQSENTWSGLRLRDSVLINNGNFCCGLEAEDSVIFNHGVLDGDTNLGRNLNMLLESGCTALNSGRLIMAGNCALKEGAQLTNLGQLTVCDLQAVGGNIVNLREMDVAELGQEERGTFLSVLNDSRFYNGGTFSVHNGANFYNKNWLVNDGLILMEEGSGNFAGALYNRHGEVEVADGAAVWHGVVFGPGTLRQGPRREVEGWLHVLSFPSAERLPERYVTVRSEAELLAALEEGEAVYAQGGITLTQPVEIHSPLYIGGSVTAEADAAVTVDNAHVVLWGEGSLRAADLRLTGGSSLFMTEGSSLEIVPGGELLLESSILTGMGGSVTLAGARLTMDAAAFVPERLESLNMDKTGAETSLSLFMTPAGLPFSAQDLSLRLERGDACFPGPTTLTGAVVEVVSKYASLFLNGTSAHLRDCAITVDKDSCELVAESVDLYLEGSTTLINDGRVYAGGRDGRITSEIAIVNRGEMQIDAEKRIKEPIQNSGQIIINVGWEEEDPLYPVEGVPPIVFLPNQ